MDKRLSAWLIIVLFIVLQIFLSRQRNKWPGLVLPAITFLYSLIAIMALGAFEPMGIGQVVMNVLTTFVIANIPTAILLAIYAAGRGHVNRISQPDHGAWKHTHTNNSTNSSVDKMNIKDL